MKELLKRQNIILIPVLTTFFLDNFALAVIYPIFTPLFLSVQAGIFPADMSVGYRILLLGFLIACFPLSQFFGAPIIGEFSDRFGRKRAFLLTILGTCMGHVFSGLSIYLRFLPFLYFARLWTGFFAGNLAICLATLADLSPDDRIRSKNFGILGGIGGIGFLLAILAGSLLSDTRVNPSFNPGFPFWLIAILSFFNLILMIFLFKESHPIQKKSDLRLLKGVQHIVHALKIRELKLPYLIYFFFILCWVTSMQFLPSILIQKFSMDQIKIAWIFVGLGAIWSVSNLFINKTLSVRYGTARVLKASLLALAFFLVLLPFVGRLIPFLVIFYFCVFFAALNWTNCLAIVSLNAPRTLQGSVMGINQSMGAIGAILGPMIGGFIAVFNVSLINLFAGLSTLIAFWLLYLYNKRPHSSDAEKII